MQLSPTENTVLQESCALVRGRFGERARLIALFGSRATWPERREINFMAGGLLDEREVLLSTFVISTERMDELRARERMIAAEIDRDGVVL